jgi:hypothetical protein
MPGSFVSLRRCYQPPVVRPLDIEFLQDFFSIPAQSASLFPERDYDTRRELVRRLFATLADVADLASVVWRMAEGIKP